MVTNFLFDFSRVILFPKDKTYTGLLNDLYKKEIVEGKNQFFDWFQFNEELLNYLQTIHSKITLSIYTTDIIQNDPVAKNRLSPLFKNIFAANNLNISKKNPNDYLVIAEKLDCLPREILFIDDGEQNIEAASKVGFQTIQYISNEKLIEECKRFY